jgi:hypothetical protein
MNENVAIEVLMTDMSRKPQTEQKHPDEWARDLNPERMEGQNIGGASEQDEIGVRSARDVKPVHRALAGFSDDELKEIPVLEPGTRLREGASYVDLQHDRSPFTARADMAVGADQAIVPKDRVPYALWNRLIGVQNPERRNE